MNESLVCSSESKRSSRDAMGAPGMRTGAANLRATQKTKRKHFRTPIDTHQEKHKTTQTPKKTKKTQTENKKNHKKNEQKKKNNTPQKKKKKKKTQKKKKERGGGHHHRFRGTVGVANQKILKRVEWKSSDG